MGEAVPPLFDDEEEWRLPPEATIADALAAYWDEIAAVDRARATIGMDDVNHGHVDEVGTHSVRRTLVPMIEDYARHCGHADLLREAVDGTVDD